MAAICRRCVSISKNDVFSGGSHCHKAVRLSFRAPICTSSWRPSSDEDRRWDSDFSSLASRGFLRAAKEYNPPPNVRELIVNICSGFLGVKNVSVDADVRLGDGTVRFKILTSCIDRLKHDIPNSVLHKITTVEFTPSPTSNFPGFMFIHTDRVICVGKSYECDMNYICYPLGDLVSYFEQNVEAKNPYDALCSRATNALDALPPNLHVQTDYVRFHPETDTMFGGVSAFPLRSTIVTGLKYKKKYKGFKDDTLLPNE